MHCLLDSARGIYLPKMFARLYCVHCGYWEIDPENKAILLEGPENELYWEAWEAVLSNAKFTDAIGRTYFLYLGESGDLFAATEEELEDEGEE